MMTNPIAPAATASLAGPAEYGDVAARVRKHIPVLDALRGIAIALVVVHNVGTEQNLASASFLKAIFFLHAPGWIGVQLFFALSGFLITGLLLDARGRPHALRTFWIRRALRIFPLYYATLFVATIVVPLALGPSPLMSNVEHNRVFYWAYVSNWATPAGHEITAFSHFWSLAVEEQFYLVWPLAVLALDDRALLRLCVGLAVVALLARIGLRVIVDQPTAVYEYTVTRMDALTLGAAAAIVARNEAWLARVGPHLHRVIVGTGVFLLAMWPLTRGFNRTDVWVQIVGYGVLSVLCAALVLATAIAPASRLATALDQRWLRWLGKYSYAIYVFHHPISKGLSYWFWPIINGPSPRAALFALVGLEVIVCALSVLAALASWNLLERWALALKDRWAKTPA